MNGLKNIFSKTKAIFYNDYLFSVVAKISGVFIGLVLSVMSARYFGPELRGVSTVIGNDISIYSVFLGLGIYQAYPFFKRKEPNIFDSYINNITTMFLVLQIIAGCIAGYMISNGVNIYLAVAIILMPAATYIKQLNYIVLIETPRRRNTNSMIISLSEILVIAFFILFVHPSAKAVISFMVICYVFNLSLSFINLRKNPFTIRLEVKRLWSFAKFGVIPMLVYLCMTINYKIDIQMLERMGVVSYAKIGIYGTAVSLSSKIWLIPDAVKDILLSKLVKGGDASEVAKVIRINLFICLLGTIAVALLGKYAVLLLYGSAYEEVYPLMVLMLTGVLSMIFYKMVYSYNISLGKRTINLIFLGGAALINFVGNLFMIPLYGIWGAAIMSVVSYTACGLAFLFYFHKASRISMRQIIFLQKEDVQMVKRFLKK